MTENKEELNIEKNELYWGYNLPLQVWPEHEDPDDEDSPVVGWEVLNYMPRKERCIRLPLDEELMVGQTRKEYMLTAAMVCEQLAEKFRKAAEDESLTIYYP
jgi:hypothetical protein